MWNLFFDPLLRDLKVAESEVIGYADDLCLLHIDMAPYAAIARSQSALDLMQQWSADNDIQFCPAKSENILFNWTRIPSANIPTLQIYSKPVSRPTHCKYLGLQINHSLDWWPHIHMQVRKAKHILRRANGALGKLWGPKPALIKWTLDAVVAPKLLYGSHVWHKLCDNRKLQDTLRQVNRLGMLAVAPCRANTPTRGLEVMLGYTPLHLKAKMKNIITKARITLFHPDIPLTGHIRDIQDTLEGVGLSNITLDDIPPTSTATLFRTYIDTALPPDPTIPWITISRSCLDIPPIPPGPIITIFTDGSKIENPKTGEWGTGAGFAIFQGTDISSVADLPPTLEQSINLCHTMSVFHAEITAIHQAILGYHNSRRSGSISSPPAIIIYSDSQAAIRALASPMVKSTTVLRCKHLLNATASLTPLHISWVKAHASSAGNNHADTLAKTGSLSPTTWTVSPRHSITITFLKRQLLLDVVDRWTQEWQSHPTCRQTKLWFPTPERSLSKKILTLDRKDIGVLIRWLTGHNFLRRHSHIINPYLNADKTCRACGMAEESAEHVIAECPALDWNRLDAFKVDPIAPPYKWRLEHMCKFLQGIAEQMEDTSGTPQPLTVLTRTGTRTFTLETVASQTDLPPSP